MSTEFERLISSEEGRVRRGRPSTLTPEQKKVRQERQRIKNRLRNEARRRAHVVLQHRYRDEFESLMEQELSNLSENDPRYQVPII